ncbi:acetyl-CoA carboxylase biotin carboxyl carrier protein [Nocardia sp. NPDC088792]|uniref:acetyl-CoA carboxylase biotin carboxyl carrier protein n=1 Tax=Nocardia sp. NPDC088792 TaxID=3364332 RepID=UPI0037F348DD
MTESGITETLVPFDIPAGGRAVSAAEADHSLAVLARHALTVRAGSAPTTVTVANGPVVLRVSWESGRAEAVAADARYAESGSSAGVSTVERVAPGAGSAGETGAANGNGAVNGNGAQTATFTLTAETVGVFYRASEPGAAPFVTEGDPVRAGQQVAIVEAMKLMIPVTAAREGVVAEFLVEDGESVEHGQPLIVFEALR